MNIRKPALHDIVAVLQDVEEQRVKAGWVGTVVEILDEGVYLIEIADAQGRTLLLPTLRAKVLLVLDPVQAGLAPV